MKYLDKYPQSVLIADKEGQRYYDEWLIAHETKKRKLKEWVKERSSGKDDEGEDSTRMKLLRELKNIYILA
jgi:hypothetical protein